MNSDMIKNVHHFTIKKQQQTSLNWTQRPPRTLTCYDPGLTDQIVAFIFWLLKNFIGSFRTIWLYDLIKMQFCGSSSKFQTVRRTIGVSTLIRLITR